MSRFPHSLAEQEAADELSKLRSLDGHINYIETSFRNTVDATMKRSYKIFFFHRWLQENAPEAADRAMARFDNLRHVVSSGRTVYSATVAKVERISARWPEWTWDLGEFTPDVYSENMIDKLVSLSRVVESSEDDRRAAPAALRQAVIARLKGRMVGMLKFGDIEEVWRQFGGKTRAETTVNRLLEQSRSALGDSPPIEKARAGPAGPAIEQDSEPTSLDSFGSRVDSSTFQLSASALDARQTHQPSPTAEQTPQPCPEERQSPGSSPSRPRPSSGHFEGQQMATKRPLKKPKLDVPPPPPPPPPMPEAPVWGKTFEAQRRHDEARVAAAATDEEKSAARAALNATNAFLALMSASMPAHFRAT